MIRVEEAEKIVSAFLPWGKTERIALDDAQGRLLAESLHADRDYPPFHRATMDGICVSWESFAAGRREYSVAGVIAAGSAETALADPTEAFEIMTGAAVPANADLVIPYEQLKIENGVAIVTEERARERFENVHRRAGDCLAGASLVPAGVKLNGPRAGIAASFGYGEVLVRNAPRVLVVATGDELVPVGEKPLAHQIRLSNGHALRNSLRAAGITRVDMAHVRDDAEALRTHFEKARREYDVLLYSGAVSMGKFDHLPSLWAAAGVEKLFHGVSQRPGKPLWFGHDEAHGTLVVGLPGNPISSLVCLHRYFLTGPVTYAALDGAINFAPPLTYFLPVKVQSAADGTLRATPLAVKNSGEFAGLAESDGFLELPREEHDFGGGRAYRFFSWSPA